MNVQSRIAGSLITIPVAMGMAVMASIAASIAVIALTAGPVTAGGWALTTLDPLPPPAPNETVEVGFTIRQHGVTPVNPDGIVGITLRSASGGVHFLAAEPQGGAGHYIAEVTFPAEGTWSWSVHQGWFADQSLGVIDLAPRPPEPATTAYRWPTPVRVGLPILTLLLATGAGLDATRLGRRNRNRSRSQGVAVA